MSDYTDAVAAGLDGMRGVSTGCCPGCESCMESDGHTDPDEHAMAWRDCNVIDEPHFSWSPCGICGCTLGGDRERWHWIDGGDEHGKGGTIIHESDACTDCVQYLANGTEPEEWRKR